MYKVLYERAKSNNNNNNTNNDNDVAAILEAQQQQQEEQQQQSFQDRQTLLEKTRAVAMVCFSSFFCQTFFRKVFFVFSKTKNQLTEEKEKLLGEVQSQKENLEAALADNKRLNSELAEAR